MDQRRQEIRQAILKGFSKHGVAANAQAINALVETVASSSADLVGDTDTLLHGLLLAGSYTVDVLESAGVNLDVIKRLASDSTYSFVDNSRADPVESLFGFHASRNAIRQAIDEGRELETADILRHAITPSGQVGESFDLTADILAACESPVPDSLFLKDLRGRVADILTYLAEYILPAHALGLIFMARRHPITDEEDWILDQQLGRHYKGMTIEELDWIIRALNAWFQYRHILIEPNRIALRLLDRMEELLFGPSHFARSGGDLNDVEVGLSLARKLAPERDSPQLGLFLRGNRIFMSPFTYRDSIWTESQGKLAQDGLAPLNLLTPTPLPLIHPNLIMQFEDIISREYVHEREIQSFLMQNPEMLQSLGYTNVRPQICLRSPDRATLIPDFILDLPGSAGMHILDLKLPGARLSVSNPYLRISSELMKAVAQLRNYAQYFENPEHRRLFEASYGIPAFKPEIIVVMGRSSQFDGRVAAAEISDQIKGVKLYTYDDLIHYAKTRSILI